MISLTPQAAAQIRAVLAEKGIADYGLKVQVVGGGCEGFLYDLLFIDGPEADDQTFESEGQKLFVDARALPILDGLVIDHGKTAHGLGFVFTNPRAKNRCTCGASFSP